MCLIRGTKWPLDMASLDKSLWVCYKHLCVCINVRVPVNSTSSVTHAEVLTVVYKATVVFGDMFQLKVNSHPNALPHLRVARLLSAHSWFWGIKHAVSRMRSATALIKNRLCCTSTLHFPKLLRSLVCWRMAKAHHQEGFSARHLTGCFK